MPFETISCDLSARGVATIGLNRPDRSNAFNQTMLNELGKQFSELAQDTNARVIVLRGNGKHFCAGADVSGRGDAGEKPEPHYGLHDVLGLLDAQPQPVVAVVQGAAVGGGAGFVACCDIVLAAESAFFSIPEVRIGMPPVRLARYLIRAMGYRSFRRYGLSGERMTAAEALRTGLAHEVCPAGDLDKRAEEIVDALLHGAPGAMRELKHAMAGMATPEIPPLSSEAPHDPTKSPEAMEGIASFREKRKPKWYPPQ